MCAEYISKTLTFTTKKMIKYKVKLRSKSETFVMIVLTTPSP